MGVKRENWKGKYWFVAREKGRILGRKRYTNKIKIESLKRLFNKNRTLDENLQRRKLSTKPYEEYSRKPDKKPRNVPFRYVISAVLRDGTELGASSESRPWPNIDDARDQAQDRFIGVLNNHFIGSYDEDFIQKAFADEIVSKKETIVYYR